MDLEYLLQVLDDDSSEVQGYHADTYSSGHSMRIDYSPSIFILKFKTDVLWMAQRWKANYLKHHRIILDCFTIKGVVFNKTSSPPAASSNILQNSLGSYAVACLASISKLKARCYVSKRTANLLERFLIAKLQLSSEESVKEH